MGAQERRSLILAIFVAAAVANFVLQGLRFCSHVADNWSPGDTVRPMLTPEEACAELCEPTNWTYDGEDCRCFSGERTPRRLR